MGLYKRFIILLNIVVVILMLTSCGTKKKTVTKISKVSEVTSNVTIDSNISRVVTDSSVALLNIVLLNIVALDSTKPIKIIDSNGKTTIFHNVKELTSTTDTSIIKTRIKEEENVVMTATAGVTTTIEEDTLIKDKLKIDTTILYIVISIVVLFSLRKYIRRIFIPF